jgi:hypothetical protein
VTCLRGCASEKGKYHGLQRTLIYRAGQDSDIYHLKELQEMGNSGLLVSETGSAKSTGQKLNHRSNVAFLLTLITTGPCFNALQDLNSSAGKAEKVFFPGRVGRSVRGARQTVAEMGVRT